MMQHAGSTFYCTCPKLPSLPFNVDGRTFFALLLTFPLCMVPSLCHHQLLCAKMACLCARSVLSQLRTFET